MTNEILIAHIQEMVDQLILDQQVSEIVSNHFRLEHSSCFDTMPNGERVGSVPKNKRGYALHQHVVDNDLKVIRLHKNIKTLQSAIDIISNIG